MIKDYKSFNSVLKLLEEVKNDIRRKDRFPVRFILIDNLEVWNEVIDKLKSFVDNTIYLSLYCFGEDTFPNVEEAINQAKELVEAGKKVLLLPLSEIIRLDNREEHKLIELMEIQIDPAKFGRIYVPLFGLFTHFDRIWKEYFDKIRRVEPYTIESNETRAINVWVIEDEKYCIKLRDILLLKGLRSYLQLWENKVEETNILLYSKCISSLLNSTVKGCVNVFRIRTPKAFIENILNIHVPFEYIESDHEYWSQLTKELTNYKDWDEYLKEKFNVLKFSKNLFYKWKELKDFERWLLYNWGKLELSDNSYLYYVLKSTKTFREFEKGVWLAMFEILNDATLNHIRERKELVKILDIQPPPEFQFKLNSLDDPIDKLKLLSGYTLNEKFEIVKCVGKYLEANNSIIDILDIIEVVYPELCFYLTIPDFGDSFVNEYVREYVFAKLKNQLTDRLKKLVRKFELWKYPARNDKLEEYANCTQIWIDALGLEWVGFIKSFIEKYSDDFSLDFVVCRANLPTISENNRLDNVKVVYDLDRIYHSDYDYPKNIVEELECVKKILLNEITKLLESENCLIITSDHGATRFSGWENERIEINANFEIERDGRFVVVDKQFQESPDYYVEKQNDRYYLISKTHKVFKGGRKAKNETHGGATLEEVLIPIIVIKRLKQRVDELRVEVDGEILAFKPILRIKASLKLDKINLKLFNEIIEGHKINDYTWEFDLSQLNLKPGKYKALIETEFTKKEIEFEIKGGMEEEDLL